MPSAPGHKYARIAELVLAAALGSCADDRYDKELEEQFYTIDCTADCPGVVGCDGKTYCNECMANAQGIRIE